MKKEQIYVTIDNEEKRLRAIEILEKAGEEIKDDSILYKCVDNHYSRLCINSEGVWTLFCITHNKAITLDQLEQLLLPNYQVKDVILPLDELKQQAKKLGFELVEKPYEPKVGDFGYFWDNESEKMNSIGFIGRVFSDRTIDRFHTSGNLTYNHFRKLTEEEKQKIQEAW
jgi:hypothetical protein